MCQHPFIRLVNGKYFRLPCGHCTECYKKRQNDWIFRLWNHVRWTRNTYDAFTFTLTYDNEHVPVISPLKESYESWLKDSKGAPYESAFSCIRYRDFQNFLKRLRHLLSFKFRYFCVAEYGSQRGRAHFHFVMFDVPKGFTSEELRKIAYNAWSEDNRKSGETKHYCTYDNFQCQKVNLESIRYVTKYFNKIDKRNHIVPSVQHMSKGLGLPFLQPEIVKWMLKTLPLQYPVGNKGHLYGLPRYYRDKVFKGKDLLRLQNKIEETFKDEKDDPIYKPLEDYAKDLYCKLSRKCLDDDKITSFVNAQMYRLDYSQPWAYPKEIRYSLEFIRNSIETDNVNQQRMSDEYVENHKKMNSYDR